MSKKLVLIILFILFLLLTIWSYFSLGYEGGCVGYETTRLGSGMVHILVNGKFFVPADRSAMEFGCAQSTRIVPVDFIVITIILGLLLCFKAKSINSR